MQYTCRTCCHAYLHAHTKECDGGHCPQSNPHHDQDVMKEYMTCKPIENKKNNFEHTISDMKPSIVLDKKV